MKITKASYVKSFAQKDHLKLTYPNQIAFAGRSNVGKSSILNSLLNRKNLAKTSSTPGKTQMVNLFSVNDAIYFVDLPGFGYAKVPKHMQRNWKELIEAFLLNNPNLKGMVLIVDIRRGLQEEELAFLDWLALEHIPVLLVANKVDKLKKQEANRQIARIRKDLSNRGESVTLIPYSARTGVGKKELWREILALTQP